MAGYSVNSVTTGKYARQIEVAAVGPQGAQGPAGEAGLPGGLSATYKFLNSYSATDPGSGFLAFNTASIFSATALYISALDTSSVSQTSLLSIATASTSQNKSVVTIQDATNTRKFSRYYITAGTSHSGWQTFNIVYIDGSARSWGYADHVVVMVSPIGDRGLPGVGIPTGGTTGQILRKTGSADYATEWVTPSVSSTALSNLVDVDLIDLADGQILVYDSISDTWKNQSANQLTVSIDNVSGTIVGGSAGTF